MLTTMLPPLNGRRTTRSRLAAVTASPYPIFYLFLLLRVGGGAKVSPAAGSGSRQLEQRFAMEPQDQTAIVGSRVTLPCRVVNKSGQLQVSRGGIVRLFFALKTLTKTPPPPSGPRTISGSERTGT